jgi:hypothetical protein
MSFRAIGKICFVLVIIGFFMPMACEQNAFQLVDEGIIENGGAVAVYGVFVAAIAGFIVGVLLLANKKVPVSVDWVITIFISGTVLIMFYNIGYVQGNHKYFQSGTYMILISSIAALSAQIISAIKKET